MFEIVVEFPKKSTKWEVNNGTLQVNGGFLLEGNSQELLVQSTASSYCNPLFTNCPSRNSSSIVDYSLCPTKSLVACNKPPYEQKNSPLKIYYNSPLQAKSLPKSTSKSSKYTYLAPYAHLASMKLSKIKVPTIHHMNVKPHKTHYKNVASKQSASKTCLSYDPFFYYHVYHLGSLLKKSKVLNMCTMVL